LVRDAIAEHAPSNFTYVNNDITAIKTKGGEALPIDILNDNVGELEQLFEDGEKWFIVVSFKGDAATAAAAVKKEKMKEGVSGGETTSTTRPSNNDTGNKGGNKLKIIVKANTGDTTEFLVRNTTKMEKIFNAYAEQRNLNVNELVFLLDGERLAGFQTPEDFDLEDGDIEDGIQIDCRVRQEGGIR